MKTSKIEFNECKVIISTQESKTRHHQISDFCPEKWNINNKKNIEIHNAIGEMIVLDNQPFTVVENRGMLQLNIVILPFFYIFRFAQTSSGFRTLYEIPSRSYITEKICNSRPLSKV